MAYAAVVAVTRRGDEIVVTIAETEAAATSEATVPLGLEKFRVHHQICDLISGTGSTVDPILGRVTNPSGGNLIVANDTAAASCNNSITGGATGYVANGTLYHRSVVDDATADHVINTEYHITVGW
jgi:hypothetical protein